MINKRFGWHTGGCVWLAGLSLAATLRAQDPRDSLVANATTEFDAARRVQLVVAALDPRLGPPTGAWGAGVQLLAQTLIEEGQDVEAGVWLRWAIRVAPGFQPDTVELLPRVVAAYRAAREFVRHTASGDDSVVGTSWIWPTPGEADEAGRIQVGTEAVPESAQLSVEGLGPARAAFAQVTPGSYAIRVFAAGYDSARVTREVLSGVTTLLQPRLRPVVVVSPPPLAATPSPVVAPRRGKGFPWVIAALGAAGAGTLVAVLAGGGKSSGPSTGGITITFPNP